MAEREALAKMVRCSWALSSRSIENGSGGAQRAATVKERGGLIDYSEFAGVFDAIYG